LDRRYFDLCIYHGGCLDGFTAAWVVHDTTNKAIEFIPAKYGDDPPGVTGRDVIIVDFSYPRDVLVAMNEQANSLLILDHHKSARQNCEGLPFAVFDMNKSGAMLTWEHFYRPEAPPEIIRYVQDGDLWRFELPHSKEIRAAMYSHPMEFIIWDGIAVALQSDVGSISHQTLLAEGEALLRDRQKTIDSLTSGWAIERQTIGGYDVPCLNCPRWLASDTLNALAVGEPFAASYYDSADKRTFELRSAPDGVDVSEVAARYGGGGHKHAAGFAAEKPEVLSS
jgi:oligoribonuclease NrnB/cAMP/cGMP phosphodiesterase (DHH superfamily)